MGITYSTESLEPPERLPEFDRLQVASEHPMHFTSSSPETFGAHVRAVDLGAVNVVDLCCSPAQVLRTPQLVREVDPGLVSVVMVRSGRLAISQGDRKALLQAGDLALYTSWQPFRIDIDSDSGPARLVRAQMARTVLTPVIDGVEHTIATNLSGRRGVSGLLGQFLTRVADDWEDYSPADAPRLGNLAVDLLTATVAHELHPDGPGSGRPRQALLSQIMTFVRRHLHDPQLSPRTIAAANHISVSYLHRLFQEHESTLGAWIRQERLDRARRDLADPRLLHLPVHRIAARWGYPDHATFTRAFRTAFGVPPRDLRHGLALPPSALSVDGEADGGRLTAS